MTPKTEALTDFLLTRGGPPALLLYHLRQEVREVSVFAVRHLQNWKTKNATSLPAFLCKTVQPSNSARQHLTAHVIRNFTWSKSALIIFCGASFAPILYTPELAIRRHMLGRVVHIADKRDASSVESEFLLLCNT